MPRSDSTSLLVIPAKAGHAVKRQRYPVSSPVFRRFEQYETLKVHTIKME
jgi:hypothetical protein